MSVPPSYADLGKAARDLFSKGFRQYLVQIPHVIILIMVFGCWLWVI